MRSISNSYVVRGKFKDKQKEEALMSVARAEELLRAVAGAAKLKRLGLKFAKLVNPIRLITRIRSRLG